MPQHGTDSFLSPMQAHRQVPEHMYGGNPSHPVNQNLYTFPASGQQPESHGSVARSWGPMIASSSTAAADYADSSYPSLPPLPHPSRYSTETEDDDGEYLPPERRNQKRKLENDEQEPGSRPKKTLIACDFCRGKFAFLDNLANLVLSTMIIVCRRKLTDKIQDESFGVTALDPHVPIVNLVMIKFVCIKAIHDGEDLARHPKDNGRRLRPIEQRPPLRLPNALERPTKDRSTTRLQVMILKWIHFPPTSDHNNSNSTFRRFSPIQVPREE